MYNDDHDIKIFSVIKKTNEPEPVVIADEMKRQAISGNLQKAKYLGDTIAKSFREAADKKELLHLSEDCGIAELTRSIKNQAIILSVFAAEYTLNNCLTDSILSTTAISQLYDTLTDDSPELYSNLLASTAFSFYYMNIDIKNIDTEIIGKTFAVLCDDDYNEALFCYGKTIFDTSVESYKKTIETIDFA